jgi:hypothetical protein
MNPTNGDKAAATDHLGHRIVAQIYGMVHIHVCADGTVISRTV